MSSQLILAYSRSRTVAIKCVEYLAEKFHYPRTTLRKTDFHVEGAYPKHVIKIQTTPDMQTAEQVEAAAQAFIAGQEDILADYMAAADGAVR